MKTDATDEELLRLILSSETPGAAANTMIESRGALNELLSRHYGWIMRVCIAELRNEPLALDCCQEILTRIAVGIRNFKFRSKFSTWCYVIVRRTIWEFIRKQKKLSRRESLSAEALVDNDKHLSAESAGSTILGALELHEDAIELWAYVKTLPTKQREAILLHYVEDLSVSDAAARIGCSVSAFKTHLFRGREKLRILLKM